MNQQYFITLSSEQLSFVCAFFEAIKMKILQHTQKHMAFYGITATQSIRKTSFNVRILIGFSIHGLVFISNCIYLLHASNSKEYIASIYSICLALFVIINFGNLIWKMKETFQFIHTFEDSIDKSK